MRPSFADASLHKARAEELITNSGVNALLVRAANVLGRESAGVTQRRFAAPFTLGVKGGRNIVQFIHPDDLGRFVGDAVEHPGWTGPVNLAAPDVIAVREVAAILGKHYVECNPSAVGRSARLRVESPPILDRSGGDRVHDVLPGRRYHTAQ